MLRQPRRSSSKTMHPSIMDGWISGSQTKLLCSPRQDTLLAAERLDSTRFVVAVKSIIALFHILSFHFISSGIWHTMFPHSFFSLFFLHPSLSFFFFFPLLFSLLLLFQITLPSLSPPLYDPSKQNDLHNFC